MPARRHKSLLQGFVLIFDCDGECFDFSWHFVLLKIPFVGPDLNLDSHRGIGGCGPYRKSVLAGATTPLFAVEYWPPEAIAPRLRAKVDPPTEVSRSRGSLRKPFVPVRRERSKGITNSLTCDAVF